jgi:hypothetical protein
VVQVAGQPLVQALLVGLPVSLVPLGPLQGLLVLPTG